MQYSDIWCNDSAQPSQGGIVPVRARTYHNLVAWCTEHLPWKQGWDKRVRLPPLPHMECSSAKSNETPNIISNIGRLVLHSGFFHLPCRLLLGGYGIHCKQHEVNLEVVANVLVVIHMPSSMFSAMPAQVPACDCAHLSPYFPGKVAYVLSEQVPA